MELTYRIAVNTPEGLWENSGTVKGFHKLLRLHLTLLLCDNGRSIGSFVRAKCFFGELPDQCG
jgi:hypothetical protein